MMIIMIKEMNKDDYGNLQYCTQTTFDRSDPFPARIQRQSPASQPASQVRQLVCFQHGSPARMSKVWMTVTEAVQCYTCRRYAEGPGDAAQ